ncbi:rod shape-determining protein MreC [Natronospora cellulosivora (SeqCode)]
MNKLNWTTILISLLVVFLIVGLGFINFPDFALLNWIEQGIYNVITPVLNFSNGLYYSLGNYWSSIVNSAALIEENKALREEISMYKMEMLYRDYYKNENIRLRELLSFKEQLSFESIGARVIGYSVTHWGDRMTINRGARDGVQERMPVVTYGGALLGRIETVGAFSSQVLLITDPEFTIGGIVEREESRAIGIVRGQINETSINIMDNISWNTRSPEGDIELGDNIVSSGLSDSFPRGLPIGRVINIESDSFALSQKAEIELYMSEKTVEEVLIITDF